MAAPAADPKIVDAIRRLALAADDVVVTRTAEDDLLAQRLTVGSSRPLNEPSQKEPMMIVIQCPLLGSESLDGRRGEYQSTAPANTPGGPMLIPNATWHHCIHCGEELLPRPLTKALESEQRRRLSAAVPVTS